MFNKLLIANRGEIACRIIKTARRMGIASIAIYSTADSDSLHTTLADSAYCVGDPEALSSYLNINAIIEVAKLSGADAIHPGYGFLSENPAFARACAEAGIVFVGPSISAMEAMGSKQLAKQRLAKTNVPLTPGYHGEDQTDDVLLKAAVDIGFPVLLKAASGGGGKGMREVKSATEFPSALAAARREAKASFGDEIMIIEKYIAQPRHVEIQLMADHFGNVVHLFERDCSIQRRHQKIIEEAPAPNLSDTLRNQLSKAAIEVAKAIAYRGAGTVEFLVDNADNCYFMEMNTRLQVEHPVTEMLTGLDLVEWQLRIAANEPLPCSQEQIQSQGHAIECRIYAEDPQHQLMPSTGIIQFLKEPAGDGIRIDTGVKLHSQITQYYDPMIAKLIAFGETREAAIQRLTRAIKHYWIAGVKTNLPLLQSIVEHPQFKACNLSTHFLTAYPMTLPSFSPQWSLFMVAGFDYLSLNPPYKTHLQADTFAWQMHLKTRWSSDYLMNGEKHTLNITPISSHLFTVEYLDTVDTLQVKRSDSLISIDDGKQIRQGCIDVQGDILTIFTEEGSTQIERFSWQRASHVMDTANHQLTSPMPATVVAVLKHQGETVKLGDPIMVLEAMKMEHTILSPHDGRLGQIFYDIGNQVSEGAELVELLPIEDTPS